MSEAQTRSLSFWSSGACGCILIMKPAVPQSRLKHVLTPLCPSQDLIWDVTTKVSRSSKQEHEQASPPLNWRVLLTLKSSCSSLVLDDRLQSRPTNQFSVWVSFAGSLKWTTWLLYKRCWCLWTVHIEIPFEFFLSFSFSLHPFFCFDPLLPLTHPFSPAFSIFSPSLRHLFLTSFLSFLSLSGISSDYSPFTNLFY